MRLNDEEMEMKIYFAPLEGITGFLYRNIYHEFFGEGMDKYFTPFIVPTGGGFTKNRSMKDVLPENNKGLPIVPQLLSNHAEDFISLSEQLAGFGYEEVNLNLGCPYRTVVSKGRGSGFLAKRKELQAFLDTIFEACNGKIAISIKTRIGLDSSQEWEELLSLYNEYPMKELIIHPRIQKDFYQNTPNMEAFDKALANSKNPLCYNGDIFTKVDYLTFCEKYPQIDCMMIGRGFLTNPGLFYEIKGEAFMTKEKFRAFHDRLYREYRALMGEDKNTLFKMKEFWNYAQYLFVGGQRIADEAWEEQTKVAEKYMKKIRKSQRAAEYDSAVNGLFYECDIREGVGFEG